MFFYKMSTNKGFGIIVLARSLVSLKKGRKNYRLWLGPYLEKPSSFRCIMWNLCDLK
jgi:hypothetical protein